MQIFRYHYFIVRIDRLGGLQYRIGIRKDFASRIAQVKVGDEFLLPLIGGSHLVGTACTVYDTDSFLFSDLRFYSFPEFGFDIRGCHGDLQFQHVVMRQRDGAREQLVSWRDGFHIKDNLSPGHLG